MFPEQPFGAGFFALGGMYWEARALLCQREQCLFTAEGQVSTVYLVNA